MASNDFNTGRDVSLDIIDPVDGPIRFNIKTGWTSEPQFDDMNSKGLDGVPRNDNVPNGHRLTMDIDRADPRLDDFFARREAAYFNGATVPLVTITETVKEISGAVSVYRYTGVALKQGPNTWRGNSPTTSRLEGMARRKIKVA